jgi:hypothetical protein
LGHDWETLTAARGNGALATAFFLGQRYAGLGLREIGEVAAGLEYSAVHAAITRFQKRLKIDQELQQKLKKVAKILRIEI